MASLNFSAPPTISSDSPRTSASTDGKIDQAKSLRELIQQTSIVDDSVEVSSAKSGSQTISVTSGKGGVGKSVVAANLAISLARHGASVCLLDANLGLGSLDLLCGVHGYWNLSHVVTGARRLDDVILEGPAGISVIPGASGLTELADCLSSVQENILNQMERLENSYDYLIVDTATGIHRSVRQFVTAADVVLLLTTPEPTAIADAYATIKALSLSEVPEINLLVNRYETQQQAQQIIARLQQTSRMFLHTPIESLGGIPHDSRVTESVNQRTPLAVHAPQSDAAVAIDQLARRLLHLTKAQPPRGRFFSRLCQPFCKASMP